MHLSFDSDPALHHRFNFNISKKHIKGRDVLDIGCWTGQSEKLAACTVHKIVGVDPNLQAIEHAKEASYYYSCDGRCLDAPFQKECFSSSYAPRGFGTSILFDPEYFLLEHRHYPLAKLRMLLSEGGFGVVRAYKTGGVFFLFKLVIEIVIKPNSLQTPS